MISNLFMPTDIIEGFELSPQQQHLWLLQQNNLAYRTQLLLSIEGKLNVEILKAAFYKLINRHEILRTTFHTVPDQKFPIQCISDRTETQWQAINLTSWNSEKQQARVEEIFIEEKQYYFDLEKYPLIRVTLMILSEQKYTLLLTLPAFYADTKTIENIVKEIILFYTGNQPNIFKKNPIQYVQFSTWQNEILAQEDGGIATGSWREKKIHNFLNLRIPFENQVVKEIEFNPQSFVRNIGSDIIARVKALAQEYKIPIYIFFLACWQILLWRLTGQSDLVVGTLRDSRSYEELQESLGLFAKYLPIHCHLENDDLFIQFLQEVNKSVDAADSIQEYFSWKNFIGYSDNSDNTSSPIFCFDFEHLNTSYSSEDVSFTLYKYYKCFDHFKVKLSCLSQEGVFTTEFHYNSHLFSLETIERLARQFETLLESAVSNSDLSISELQILSVDEQHQLLFEWNDNESEYPTDKCIHQLFEEQVQKAPHAVAVVFENQQLTYLQLNQRANQLAHHLQSLGVESEVLVGIFVERSVEMVVGLLGILKAGGAYVPLDPTYPQERLSYMLADSSVEVLLTHSEFVSSLPSHTARVVCLDTDWGTIEQQYQDNLNTEVKSDNLAYVIYTSGSTGQPKGVLVEHKNVVCLFAATQSWYHFNANDVWTNFHSITFDFSVWEIWGALFYGGRLVIVPYWISRDPKTFYNLLECENVTVLNQTPSAFRQLISVEKSDNTQPQLSLRLVIFGGEALELLCLKPWFEQHGDQSPKLVNMYGITETTVHVTYRPLTINDLNSSGNVIGRPIPGLQMYILDDNLQPVPIGVKGQIYVGGYGLARGYLNRQQLTTERFISHPFNHLNHQLKGRLYKTGDLARYLPNGDIEYLGRIDNQVKVRGFRIELGEIEAALNTHPQIQQAVVVAKENIPGNKRLVAYVVTSDESLITNQLRKFLKQKLPEYMVPSALVILDTLPLTPNGKIDRKVLSAIDTQYPELNTDFMTPRTLEEELLAQIWSEVLGVEQVGIYDNFFELGGDSLLSVQVLAKVNKSGLELSLQQMFENQTIHDLVKVLRQSDLSINIVKVKTAPFSLISSEERRFLPNGVEDAYPLTRLQLGMLFHSEYAPETAVYHDVFSYYLKAPLNVQIFHSVIEQIVIRHPVLRTSIAMTQFAQPLQLVHSQVSIKLTVENLCSLPLDEQENNIATWIEQEKQRPFVWDVPPLIRFHIHQRSSDTFNFTFSFHHAILDGWSVATLVTELLQHYFFLLDKMVPPLKVAPNLTFRDYVALEQETLQSQECQQYWHEKLAGFTMTELPRWADSQQHNSVEQVRSQEVKISPALSTQLKQFATKVGVPVKSVLLAAHMKVMSFLSNQADITTGVVTHGRQAVEDSERVLGLFLNTMPLRMQLSGGTWVELVEQTFETEREALPFQQYPLAQLQQEVGQPLFKTIFNYTNFHVYQGLSGIDNLEVLGGEFFEQTNFTFTAQFSVNPITSQIELNLTYDPSQFSFLKVRCIGGYYSAVLVAMVTQLEERYERVCLLSEAERHQLLMEWNDTQSEYPTDKCIHQLFEQQVQKTPHAVAVVFENQQLTYQELNQRANQLAHHLQSLGVESEVLVGICVERSVEMVVGLLGILKAGGAYVPLDPTYPQERLSYMLADSGVEVLLTDSEFVSFLLSHNARVVCLDTDWGVIEKYSQENFDTEICSGNLAYVIYTSGSTGQPKGVMNTHMGIHNRLRWMQQSYQLSSGDRIVQKTPFSFDVSVWEVFWPLLTGARIVVALPEGHKDSTYLVNLISQQQITTIHFVPSMLQVFLLVANSGNCSCLKRVFCSGEALSFELTQRFFSKLKCELHNLYGPTEAAIDVTFWQCLPQENLQIIPIGCPISNTQIYILDSHLQPLPIGVPGELYIGGDGLARGYLNRPELTSEKFIPNPFSNSKSERLYKTGDLARHLADGNITFIGRIDHQVKVRGFRIELGEIEAVLNTHLQIEQALVIAKEDIPGNKHLVAYVVPCDKSLTTNQLREFLQQKLPEYMVPSAFVFLDTLPLTPNGKIDTKALPAPNGEITREQEYIAPRKPTEEIIANTFAVVLGVQNVGIHDNFFRIGGHSLLATQLISRLRSAFAVEIPIRAVFESPTVAQLDETLTQLRTVDSGFTVPPIQPIKGDRKQLPLSFAQERLWFLNQLEGSTATYNIPAAVGITGDLNLKALQQALSEIVRRHSILRTSFQTVNGTPRQVIYSQATINIEVVDLQQHSAIERETLQKQLAQTQAITPFSLEIAPLIRCSVLQLSVNEYVLLLTIHHIVSDGWSIGVFIQELSASYQASCAGIPSPLSELSIQYADFAVWQRQWLSESVLETQLNYWLCQLAGAPELLQLPTDRSRPVVQTYRGRTYSFTLNIDITQKLQSLSRASGTTLFMTLLAAFSTLLYRYSGQPDILVGTPIANRNRSEIESLIGFFVNTLVLRTRFEDNPTFESLLSHVRETTLQAYEHQDVPFEQVVEALQPQRSLAYSPLFQVMFVLQNAPMGELELPGCTWCKLHQESTIAKFDLTLSMRETDQELVGEWEYNTDLFDSATIERMASHFQNLLSVIVENPVAAVGELPLLSKAERHQLLVEWNETVSIYPQDKCIHQLFEEQVQKTPHAVAVVFENQQLTYQALNQRANQLAHHLQSLAVESEVLVGICIERSVEMVVGLLGILKAGGAYVPLDPTYPQERLSYMLADSGVEVLLTDSEFVSSLPSHNAQVVCLDTDWGIIEQYSQENFDARVDENNLAYVIYTSGSTGQPKGVMLTHKSATNFLHAMQQKPGLTASDILLAVTTISFDIAVLEIYLPLVVGAKVVIASREMTTDGKRLLAQLVESSATVMQATPATWHLLVASGWESDPQIKILCGGEALTTELANQLRPRSTSLWNLYGPTETTVWSSVYHVEAAPSHAHGQDTYLSIGTPIANTQIYLLDAHLQPVPIGVPGELHIGGAGLARGYLNLPQLSLEKFIPHPNSPDPQARLYKTGDLASYLANGSIEYLGRLDHQIKLRGFRIELGEIEAVLNTYPHIQQAVVTTREDIPTNKRLVAYVVTRDQSLTTNQLRDFLKQQLPEYMVPSAFVFLDTLPLTPNGKIDTKELPAPDGEMTRSTEAYVKPQTELERMIATIWQDVLQVEKVGLHDNFFAIGGHSLLLTRVHSQLQEVFNQDISILEMFKYPTVRSFAQYLNQEKSDHLSSLDKSNNQLENMKEGRNRLKQRLVRSSVINQEK